MMLGARKQKEYDDRFYADYSDSTSGTEEDSISNEGAASSIQLDGKTSMRSINNVPVDISGEELEKLGKNGETKNNTTNSAALVVFLAFSGICAMFYLLVMGKVKEGKGNDGGRKKIGIAGPEHAHSGVVLTKITDETTLDEEEATEPLIIGEA